MGIISEYFSEKEREGGREGGREGERKRERGRGRESFHKVELSEFSSKESAGTKGYKYALGSVGAITVEGQR